MKSDKRDSRFIGIVRQYLYERKMTQETISKLIGVSKNTFSAKMQDPSRFTVWEMRQICDILRVPATERNFI